MACDDELSLASFIAQLFASVRQDPKRNWGIAHKQEGENDTANEQPLADVERNENTTVLGIISALVKDLV